MTEFERIEKQFKQLRAFLLERQSEDPDADRDDEGDGYNIAVVDLHKIKLAFFALAQERDRLRADKEKCHEIMESQSHQLASTARQVRELRDELERLKAELCTAWEQAERWKDERDEARRLVCRHTKKMYHTLKRTAELRGWDCFKEASE